MQENCQSGSEGGANPRLSLPLLVARRECLGLEFGHFEDGFQGGARSLARAIGEEESKNQRGSA